MKTGTFAGAALLVSLSLLSACSGGGIGEQDEGNEVLVAEAVEELPEIDGQEPPQVNLTTFEGESKMSCDVAAKIATDFKQHAGQLAVADDLFNIAMSRISLCRAEAKREVSGPAVVVAEKKDDKVFFDTIPLKTEQELYDFCMDLATGAGVVTDDARAMVLVTQTGPMSCQSLRVAAGEDNLMLVTNPQAIPTVTTVDAIIAAAGMPEVANLRNLPSDYYKEVGSVVEDTVKTYEQALKDVADGRLPSVDGENGLPPITNPQQVPLVVAAKALEDLFD